VGVRTSNRRQQAEAIRLLTAAPQDAEVQVRLADHLERADYHGRALVLPGSLRQDERRRRGTFVTVASGLLDQAIALWREAFEAQPLAWPRRAICRIGARLRAKRPAAQEFCLFE